MNVTSPISLDRVIYFLQNDVLHFMIRQLVMEILKLPNLAANHRALSLSSALTKVPTENGNPRKWKIDIT